jgi:alkaline phosphatase
MNVGSRIDMAGHNNDPAAQYLDTLAYNDAFQVAKDYSEENSKVLIVLNTLFQTTNLACRYLLQIMKLEVNRLHSGSIA